MKTILALLACVALSIPASGQEQQASSTSSHAAIAAVFNARQVAFTNSFKFIGVHKRPVFQPARFNKAIQQIDGRACPKNFYLAWLDYQHAWTVHLRQQAQKGDKLLIDTAVILLSAGTATPLAAAKTTSDAAKPVFDTQQAWWNVEKQAVIFDCPLPIRTPDF